MHEIVVSDIFLEFISEDFLSSNAITGAQRSRLIENMCEIDLLLENEIPIVVTVKKVEEASFLVRPGQLVVWRFSTVDYDIGFSVEVNSETKLAFTRYRAFEKPVYGSIEIGIHGACVLRWDNSYSKCAYEIFSRCCCNLTHLYLYLNF